MLPRQHLIYGLIFSIAAVLIFNISINFGIIIFLASLLIDIDHYFTYVYRKKDLNIFRTYQYWIAEEKKWRALTKKQKSKTKLAHFLFHGIESLIILLFLSQYSNIFFYIFLGFTFHLFLDYILIIQKKDPLSIKFSQILLYFKNKKLENSLQN